ncbi:MAG TPA: dihydropteroate synthase [Ignavibacteriaceae bacterium]|nr:dihydropteroate synthase [Ignavibacteriaceae bacterium]
MNIQIIDLSDYKVFKIFINNYKIFKEVHEVDLFGLELRDIQPKLANNVQRIILREKENCFKRTNGNSNIDLLFTGNISGFKELSENILASGGDEDLAYKILNSIENYSNYNDISYKIGNKEFSFNHPYIMGILNVTEDSFSDGGLYFRTEEAVNHAIVMINDGADIIDIGGESTRPGAKSIHVEKEIKRVIPVVKEILKQKPGTIISVDTTKSEVAEEALQNGAKIINDISGFSFDPKILDVVKKYNASYILMHIKGTPENMQKEPIYDDIIKDIYDYLAEKSKQLKKKDVTNIIIDPGIGFGKNMEHNFELLKRLENFKSLGFPILIGLSRKSFMGKILNLNTELRDLPTSVLEAIAINNGARIIRTHNVKNGVQVCKLMSKLI